MNRWVVAWLVAGVALALPAPGSAQWAPGQAEQAQPERKAKNPRARAPQPDLDEEDQLSPRQLDQRPPGRPARQSEPPPGQADRPTAALPPRAAEGSRTAAEGARTIACAGVFGKDSSHLKLATRFDARNVAFTQVDGPEGSRLMASVLFPNDPKRRLEVLWQNEASRTETHLIVINGRSTWTAPKGLRLGLPLAALEKLNGKPFRMSGFDQPNGGSAIDWDGGALDRMPGGCRLGIRLAPDARATEAARNEVIGTEFVSNDPKMRALRPTVAEILIGY